MIRISPETDLVSLFRAAKNARGDVWFQTAEGDRLNMKSLLSQYLILAAVEDEKAALWKDAQIVFDNAADAEAFADIV